MKTWWLSILLLFAAPIAVAQETFLYVVDVGPNRNQPWQVIRYDEDGSNPVLFTNQGLNRPQDVVFIESRGVALVSNLLSGSITEHDAETGAFIRNFAAGIGQPTRMEFGEDGLLYVLQWAGTGRVLRYDLEGNLVDNFTTVAVTNSIGFDWDAAGDLYVASFDQAIVRRFDAQGNDLGVFVDDNLLGPTNIWFDDDGTLLVLDWTAGSIKRFDAMGNFVGVVAGGLNQPEGVAVLDDGSFLVGNGGTSSVRQFDASGQPMGDLVASGSGGLATPNGLRLRTVSDFAINPGLNDAWFNPATNGQGFFINVFPDSGAIFAGWFTFETMLPGGMASVGATEHRWLTAIGSWDGNIATLDVFLTTGGFFDDPTTVDVSEAESYGTITIEFADCSTATLTYDLFAIGLSGVIPIQRIVPDNAALCEALAGS